jgi:hypothetical protein
MGVGPTTSFGAMAFDPDLGSLGGEFVYFGGCFLPPSSCPTNVTWVYNGVSWSPASSSTLPPALTGAMMDFDPTLGGAVLVGGMATSGAAMNQTWLFTDSGWSNLSGSAWGRNAPPSAFGSLAWDPDRNGLVLVDGCDGKPACTSYGDGTWLLNSTGWHRLGNGPGTPNAIAFATMAWDPSDRILVLFGGNDSGARLLNETWLYNGTAWANATGVVPGCKLQCYYPAGRESALSTWDYQLGTLVMFGGTNTTAATIYNDTWSYNRASGWKPYDQLTGLVDPVANVDGSIAENSSGTAPLLVAGFCAKSAPGGCLGDDWTLDSPPAPVVSTLGPLPADAGVPVTVRLNVSQATGAGPTAAWLITFGDGGFKNGHAIKLRTGSGTWNFSASHVYASGGAYNVTYSASDFFFVVAEDSTAITIGPLLTLNATGTPGTTIAGEPVRFSANASGGTPPYHYVWMFGDGGSAVGANATHAYTSAGVFQAVAQVTDAGRGTMLANVSLSVGPALVASLQLSFNPVDALATDQFSGNASGGMGAPYTLSWEFGDGGVGVGTSSTHAYALPGPETVTLEAKDRAGYTTNQSLVVLVNAELAATATSSANTTPPGQPVTFDVTYTGGTSPYAFSWLFGDGGRSSSSAPTHDFTQTGAFTVSVWVNDSGGGSVRERLTVAVTESNPCPGCSPPPVQNPAVPLWLIGVIIAALAGGLLLGWWFMRRSDRRPPPPTPRSSVTPTPPPQEPTPGSGPPRSGSG